MLMLTLNGLASFLLISILFAAIYKVLPDRPIAWREVALGSAVTALLFTAGKSLIGWYIGSTAVASSYGAAGALIVILLWVYYSAQIFLLGAEFTKASFRPSGARVTETVTQVFLSEPPLARTHHCYCHAVTGKYAAPYIQELVLHKRPDHRRLHDRNKPGDSHPAENPCDSTSFRQPASAVVTSRETMKRLRRPVVRLPPRRAGLN
jgi:Zn-dependent protease with chaperone function